MNTMTVYSSDAVDKSEESQHLVWDMKALLERESCSQETNRELFFWCRESVLESKAGVERRCGENKWPFWIREGRRPWCIVGKDLDFGNCLEFSTHPFPYLSKFGFNKWLLQPWPETRWTLLRETSARTGKSPQGHRRLLFLVKRLVRLKHQEGFMQSVVIRQCFHLRKLLTIPGLVPSSSRSSCSNRNRQNLSSLSKPGGMKATSVCRRK